MNYSNDPAHVRVDVFRERGKWYETVMLDMRGHYDDVSIPDCLIELWKEQHKRPGSEDWRFKGEGFWLVCLEPYHKNEHPQMVPIP